MIDDDFKQRPDTPFRDLEIQRLKTLLNELNTNGLKTFDSHKDLVLNYLKKKIREDLEFFEKDVT